LFGYVKNDPVDWVDPWGLDALHMKLFGTNKPEPRPGAKERAEAQQKFVEENPTDYSAYSEFVKNPMGPMDDRVQRANEYAQGRAEGMGNVLNYYRESPIPLSWGDIHIMYYQWRYEDYYQNLNKECP
jgi:hypothetical protein